MSIASVSVKLLNEKQPPFSLFTQQGSKVITVSQNPKFHSSTMNQSCFIVSISAFWRPKILQTEKSWRLSWQHTGFSHILWLNFLYPKMWPSKQQNHNAIPNCPTAKICPLSWVFSSKKKLNYDCLPSSNCSVFPASLWSSISSWHRNPRLGDPSHLGLAPQTSTELYDYFDQICKTHKPSHQPRTTKDGQ